MKINSTNDFEITIRTPYKTCTVVAIGQPDMTINEVLDDLVAPALIGVGYTIEGAQLDVVYETEL
jgi:hypothetical protein